MIYGPRRRTHIFRDDHSPVTFNLPQPCTSWEDDQLLSYVLPSLLFLLKKQKLIYFKGIDNRYDLKNPQGCIVLPIASRDALGLPTAV